MAYVILILALLVACQQSFNHAPHQSRQVKLLTIKHRYQTSTQINKQQNIRTHSTHNHHHEHFLKDGASKVGNEICKCSINVFAAHLTRGKKRVKGVLDIYHVQK